MKFCQALTTVWALAAVSQGFVADNEEDFNGEGYTLYEQEVGNGTRWRHPSVEMLEMYMKYNGTAPEDVVLAAEAARKGTVKNFPGRQDSYYLVPTKIGTPPQTLMLDFDTGSSDLWVYSSKSPAKIRKGHSIYTPAKSKSSKLVKGAKWSIHYGDGSSAGGTVYRDVVRLGPVAIKGQAVEAAKRVGGSFSRTKAIDGIFGSGFSSGNTVRPRGEKVWFANAKLNKKVFGALLNAGKPGAYDIGFINAKHHSGSVHYTKVQTVRAGYWQFSTQGYQVGGGARQGTRFTAIADTGTSVNYIPLSALRKYYRSVRSAGYNNQVGGIIFKCGEKLPSFSIFIGGSRRTIPAKYINAGFVGTSGGQRFCFGGLQQNNGLGGLSILGDTFLKSQYTVFDYGKKRIGFANKK